MNRRQSMGRRAGRSNGVWCRSLAAVAVVHVNSRFAVHIVLPRRQVNGSLTGFGEGLDIKTQLLEHEGDL